VELPCRKLKKIENLFAPFDTIAYTNVTDRRTDEHHKTAWAARQKLTRQLFVVVSSYAHRWCDQGFSHVAESRCVVID